MPPHHYFDAIPPPTCPIVHVNHDTTAQIFKITRQSTRAASENEHYRSVEDACNQCNPGGRRKINHNENELKPMGSVKSHHTSYRLICEPETIAPLPPTRVDLMSDSQGAGLTQSLHIFMPLSCLLIIVQATSQLHSIISTLHTIPSPIQESNQMSTMEYVKGHESYGRPRSIISLIAFTRLYNAETPAACYPFCLASKSLPGSFGQRRFSLLLSFYGRVVVSVLLPLFQRSSHDKCPREMSLPH